MVRKKLKQISTSEGVWFGIALLGQITGILAGTAFVGWLIDMLTGTAPIMLALGVLVGSIWATVTVLIMVRKKLSV